MATATSTLIQRTRRYVRDWPELDTLGASISSTATTVTSTANPANGTYSPNWVIQVDQEAMLVRTASSAAASLTVLRGAMGTTAASHASGATVLVRPHFLDLEILDALNRGLDACFPLMYQAVQDVSLAGVVDQYEYTVPNVNGVPMPYVSMVEFKDEGDLDYYPVRSWSVRRGATPKIVFRRVPPEDATIRVTGFAPFAHLTVSGSLSAQWPANADDVLVLYAASDLLASGEAGRVRSDTQAVDSREQANRAGSSMSAANALYNRFLQARDQASMGPMPKHARSVL